MKENWLKGFGIFLLPQFIFDTIEYHPNNSIIADLSQPRAIPLKNCLGVVFELELNKELDHLGHLQFNKKIDNLRKSNPICFLGKKTLRNNFPQ